MHQLNRLIFNICSDDLSRTKAFYTKLFRLKVVFDSDWYVQLHDADQPFEAGIMDRNSELISMGLQALPNGAYFTFVVAYVDEVGLSICLGLWI